MTGWFDCWYAWYAAAKQKHTKICKIGTLVKL